MILLYFSIYLVVVSAGYIGFLIRRKVINSNCTDELKDVFIDRFVGILVIAAIAHFAAFITPTTDIQIAFILALLAVFILNRSSARLNFQSYVLLGVVSAYTSAVIYWGDSGAYHLSLVDTIREYGLTVGYGNFDPRFGASSSFFSLSSIFTSGKLLNIYQLPNAALTFVLLDYVFEMARDRFSPRMLFTVFWGGATIILLIRWGVVISPSPDLVLVMAPFVFFLFLTDKSQSLEQVLYFSIVLTLLSGLVRMSSLVMLSFSLVVFIAILITKENKITDLFANKTSAIFFILILSLILTSSNLILTGYPLYPSELITIDVPWRVDPNIVSENSRVIQDFAKCGAISFSDGSCYQMSGFQIMTNWITSRIETITFLLTLSSILLVLLMISGRVPIEFRIKIFIIGALISIVFIYITVPTLRFLFGFLSVINALWAYPIFIWLKARFSC